MMAPLQDADATPCFDSIGLSARLVKSYGEDAAQQALLELWQKGQRTPELWLKPAFELERLARTIAKRRAANERRGWRWVESLDAIQDSRGREGSEESDLHEQGRDASPEAVLLAEEARQLVEDARTHHQGHQWVREAYGRALTACH